MVCAYICRDVGVGAGRVGFRARAGAMRVLVANTSTFFPPRQLYCILMTCTGTVIVSLAFFLLNLAAALVWSTLTGIGTVNAYCDGMLSDTELAAMSKSTPAMAGGTPTHGEGGAGLA